MAAWWRKAQKDPSLVTTAEVLRDDLIGIRVTCFHGDDESDPCLQVATLWHAPSGDWVVIKRQPVIQYEDVLQEPSILGCLAAFIAAVGEMTGEPE